MLILASCDNSKKIRVKCKNRLNGAIIFVDQDTTDDPISLGETVYISYANDENSAFISNVPQQTIAIVDSFFQKK